MASSRIAFAALALLIGCGTPTTPPAPPLDDDKLQEISLKNLQSEDAVQRMIAVSTLGALGAKSKDHLSEVKKLVNDSNENVRNAAKDAVQKIEKGG